VTVAPQLNVAFANGTPDYLSLTVGGNDIHWADFVGSCYVSACDTPANTAAADAYLATYRTNLKAVFEDIKARSHGHAPTTVITGYYNPMSAACAAGPITGSEVAWVSAQVAKINASIQSVADDYRYVTYAPLDFTGHDICSADPWLQRPGYPGESDPFHPNTVGQQQIAKAILRSL
jgi:lysophospholipase L1-like esterase